MTLAEQKTFAWKRPTTVGIESIFQLYRDASVAYLKEAAATVRGEAATEADIDSMGQFYLDAWDAYERDGTLPSPTFTVRSIVQDGRVTTNPPFVVGAAYDPKDLARIEELSVETFEVDIDAFYAASGNTTLSFTGRGTTVTLDPRSYMPNSTPVTFEALESIVKRDFIDMERPTVPGEAPKPFRVFVGHGNDHQWRILRDQLQDHHGFEIEAFEGKPRAGQTIRDVIEDMAINSTAAVLVLVKSDSLTDGTFTGRQNVVHELGYFQAKLGWDKAILVVEEGVTVPSNLDGTQQVRFSQGQIDGGVGGVVAALNALRSAHEAGVTG